MNPKTAGNSPLHDLPALDPPVVAPRSTGRGLDSAVAEELMDLVLENEDVEGFLEDLAGFSAARASATGQRELSCAICLHRPRRPVLRAGSTPRAARPSDARPRPDAEPWAWALQENRTVLVPDIALDTRWPECGAQCEGEGIRALLAIPLRLEREAAAVFTFQAPAPGVFSDALVQGAERFVSLTAKAFRLAARLDSRAQEICDLHEAMKSRTAIDLAVGVIMGQQRCSQEAAFRILARAASTRNQKLRLVASELLGNVSGTAVQTHFES